MHNDLDVGLWNTKINDRPRLCSLRCLLNYVIRRRQLRRVGDRRRRAGQGRSGQVRSGQGKQARTHLNVCSMPCQQVRDTRHQLPSPDLASCEMWPRQSVAAPTWLRKLAAHGMCEGGGKEWVESLPDDENGSWLLPPPLETQRIEPTTAATSCHLGLPTITVDLRKNSLSTH